MPKKPSKNAFFFFMLELQNQQRDLGHSIPNGLADVSIAASPIWERMTSQEKAPYERQAKDAKAAGVPALPSVARSERYSTQGIPLSVIDRIHSEEEFQKMNMRKEINEIAKESYQNNTIASQEYVFVAGNYFCKTLCDVFIPAELALVKYTIAEGFGQSYHTFINPKRIPQGYAFEAHELSQKGHRLPMPPNALGQSNYDVIMKEILKFVGTSNANTLPPLFTESNQMPIVKSIFRQLCTGSNENLAKFRIFPLAELFFVLKGEASKYGLDVVEAFQSIHIAQTMIDRDPYEYRTDAACSFHEGTDYIAFCPLSKVIRWTFTFSDHICLDLGIDMIPGRHVPIDSGIMVGAQYRDDVEDTQSMISSMAISDVASNATSYQTNYTKPKTRVDSDSVSLISEMSFATTIKSEHLDLEKSKPKREPDEMNNPWFSRNNAVARAPLDDSLVFPFGNFGRGRGVLLNVSLSPNRRIFGRGKVE